MATTVASDDATKEEATAGKERVGIIRLNVEPQQSFSSPGWQVVKKYYNYGREHKRHGEVKGPPFSPNQVNVR
jgi:hypothetical protein